jgi:hypothetical protein
MSQPHTSTASAAPSVSCSPSIRIEYSFPSQVAATSRDSKEPSGKEPGRAVLIAATLRCSFMIR